MWACSSTEYIRRIPPPSLEASGQILYRAVVRRLAVLFGVLVPMAAHASPNVALDDPRYEELATYFARGLLPLYRGGTAPLTEARVRKLLVKPPLPRGGWLRLDRALVRGAYDDDRPRSYSTFERPRQIAGSIAITCEHDEGRPCDGLGTLGEIDGSAGIGDYISGTLRVRANAGTQGYDAALAIDRLYVNSQLGPVALELGRDVLVLGPRSRTQLGWGDHAPALDQVRLSTVEPVPLVEGLRGNVLYAVARLRDPQRFTGTLLTASRVQLDIADRVELGAQQLVMLGGDGAAPIGGPIDFVLEHLRRREFSGGATDSSNRRFGGDVSWLVPELRGARLYYQLMFEDIRRARWMDAVRYDADHLFGLELASLGNHALTVEYHQTGVRAQEHGLRVTGLTNAGRVGGSPLGPDAKSLYVGGRVALPHGVTLYPWLERASLTSDTYAFVEYGPISLATLGRREFRTRAGSRARLPLRSGFSVEAEALLEYVTNYGFQRGTVRTNGRLAIDLVWRNPR